MYSETGQIVILGSISTLPVCDRNAGRILLVCWQGHLHNKHTSQSASYISLTGPTAGPGENVNKSVWDVSFPHY